MRIWFLVLSLSQFHIPYYAGRTLPNCLALPFGEPFQIQVFRLIGTVTYAISTLLRSLRSSSFSTSGQQDVRTAVIILTATATLVRLEIALFLLPTILSLVLLGRLSIRKALSCGVIGGFGSLSM